MSTAAKPEKQDMSMYLADKAARREARIAEIKARNALVVEINNQSWGASLTPRQQRAFAEYMRRFRLDISEVDNLGGRPYRNGRYYMRRCAELVAEGRVEWYKGDHIGPDERLAQMAREGDAWAKDEMERRIRERIRLAVPADATFAYVVTVKMKELSLPTEGVKFFIPGRKKKVWRSGQQVDVNADPVGDEHPSTSVETRAWRRCGRIAFAEIPELRAEESTMEDAASATQEAVVEEALRAEDEGHVIASGPLPIDKGATQDPYGLAPQRALGEGAAQPVTVRAGEHAKEPTTERVASAPPPANVRHVDEVEFIDDRDIMND